MRVSFSQIGTFEQCPFKWYLHYVEELETILDKAPNDALILGNALHKGLELRDAQAAVDYYREHMNIGSDLTVNEEIKLRAMVAKGLESVPDGLHETALEVEGEFKGFIDLLVPVEGEPETFDMYDYKYANPKSADKYRESGQLSVYRYYFERLGMGTIRKMGFILFPKTSIRQKKTETLDGFRRRLREELEAKEPQLIEVEYDQGKVDEFLAGKKLLEAATSYPKQPSRLCDWCDYQSYCEGKEETMMLPKAERHAREEQGKIKLWVYGDPFSGKTTFANGAPMPLFLNTDGNVKFIDAPAIHIGDRLETEGRMTKKVFGWATFKDTVAELEKDPQGFETVVVDLVEGVYELCRTYMYDKRGWEHESDDSFKAWDIVRKEFLDTMRRVTNLNMNVVLISHEDSSRDFTRPAGNKVTALKPNISDKVAKQLAGMVDVVARAVIRDGAYLLTFKSDETVFGGGRLKMSKTELPLDWGAFEQVYHAKAKEGSETAQAAEKPDAEKVAPRPKRVRKAAEKPAEEPLEAPLEEVPFDADKVEEPEIDVLTLRQAEPPAPEQVEEAPKPKRRVRRKREE